jgi:WXG100 family type VII secretion target
MKIRIDTQNVRSVAREMAVRSEQLSEMGHELQGAIAGLDTWAWDGVSRSRAESMLSRVRPKSDQVARELDELARKLRRVADVFEQEDSSAAQNLSGMPWVELGITASTGAFLTGTGTAMLALLGGILGRDRRESAEIRADEVTRRPPGGRGGGSLNNDWAGRMILARYLSGGEDWTIVNDPEWTAYMEADPGLESDMENKLSQFAQDMFQSGQEELSIDESFSQELENGEGIVGYQYLHGTNANVGGFELDGNAKISKEGDGYAVKFDLDYTWNDVIDPNAKYRTDVIKNTFAEVITLGQADPYALHITWSEETIVHLDARGQVVSVEGWPGG